MALLQITVTVTYLQMRFAMFMFDLYHM